MILTDSNNLINNSDIKFLNKISKKWKIDKKIIIKWSNSPKKHPDIWGEFG